MANEYAIVKVILKGKQAIESPEPLPRDEAESLVAEIGKARVEGETVSLPWLNVAGSEVVAVYLELKPESVLKRLAREGIN